MSEPAHMRRVVTAMERLRQAAQRTSFVLLDVVIDATAVDARAPASWEVERERFLRGLPDYDAGGDARPMSDDLEGVAVQICRAYMVPPACIGSVPGPETREDAARLKIAYIEAVGADPLLADDADVRTVAFVDRCYASGIFDRAEAECNLAPLQARP